jgi:hypothetical protein
LFWISRFWYAGRTGPAQWALFLNEGERFRLGGSYAVCHLAGALCPPGIRWKLTERKCESQRRSSDL